MFEWNALEKGRGGGGCWNASRVGSLKGFLVKDTQASLRRMVLTGTSWMMSSTYAKCREVGEGLPRCRWRESGAGECTGRKEKGPTPICWGPTAGFGASRSSAMIELWTILMRASWREIGVHSWVASFGAGFLSGMVGNCVQTAAEVWSRMQSALIWHHY